MTKLILILSLLVGLIAASGEFSRRSIRPLASLAPKPPLGPENSAQSHS